MKDMNQTTQNMAQKDEDAYKKYKNNAYYYISSKRHHEDAYQYDPNPQQPIPMAIATRNEKYDKEQMKIMWKKERNRLAAKKSRDKKAVQIRELEYRDRRMTEEIKVLKECVNDYDNILAELVGYIEYILSLNRNENRDDFILLFDCLCKLKKSGKDQYLYLTDISGLVDRPLKITNEKIDTLTCKIRDNLREFLSKNNRAQDQ